MRGAMMMCRFLKHQKHHGRTRHQSKSSSTNSHLNEKESSHRHIDRSISWWDAEQFRQRQIALKKQETARKLWWAQVNKVWNQVVLPSVTLGAVAVCLQH